MKGEKKLFALWTKSMHLLRNCQTGDEKYKN